MTTIKTSIGRRSFIKASALTGGGLVLGFSMFTGCKPTTKIAADIPKEWFRINAYLKIANNGQITILSPNPEIGQNVKTSMPMIVAEELDVDWSSVIVEQAPLDVANYSWQVAGGSRSISSSWKALRSAGATAKEMLKTVAAQSWGVPVSEITTELGKMHHLASNRSAHYGTFASAASKLEVPKEVKLKDVKDFKIIGSSRKNVDAQKIVTGKPLFGLDYKVDGMLIAMIAHPPSFGLKLKSFDATEALSMPGIKSVFSINLFHENYDKSAFDATSFPELVAIVGNTTWEVMKAKETLKIDWEPIKASQEKRTIFGNKVDHITPEGFESSTEHFKKMSGMEATVKTVRTDGNPKEAFARAAKVLERSYSCPFLPHNTMEPMNFFADVKDNKIELTGPIQTPEWTEKSVSALLNVPLENITVNLTRMGGGFGRRLYGHFVIEAAKISQKMNAPVKLIYNREDDMTSGIYRPAYFATYKAAIDKDNNLIGFHVNAGGIPESPLAANRFPAGCIDNYLAEDWSIPSNISTGAWRAPRSNFIAGAEQSFLDEVAEVLGKDPIDFRLELLERSKSKPIGAKNDYNADRYAGVLKLVKEKSNWVTPLTNVHRGVAAYFCHDTYVAHVVDVMIKDGSPFVEKVTSAVDCGIVINPDAATNLSQGAVVDGIGHAMYSEISFENGKPNHNNFNSFKLIRHHQAPKSIDVHFVKSDIDPTGMGEPSGPPVYGALANALYKATGQRFYHQPFAQEIKQEG